MNYNTSGIYLLKIYVNSPIKCNIGKLGSIEFQSGFYGYIGSALLGNRKSSKSVGPLLRRIQRHVKPTDQKKMHWHIDYFLANPNVQITSILMLSTLAREECEVARYFSEYALKSIPKFGCSDCNCLSHCFYFGEKMVFN